MRKLYLILTILALQFTLFGQGYKVGDEAVNFNLKNVDGKYISSSDYNSAKGFIVVFTCNTCPYAVAYEDRLIELDNKYKAKGFPLIAINPNDPEVKTADSYNLMQQKAKERAFKFPYLYDPGRKISEKYGATKTPQIYLLSKKGKSLKVEYIGAIDDNYEDVESVKKKYLANAIDALLNGKKPNPATTKAIGCSVKKKS